MPYLARSASARSMRRRTFARVRGASTGTTSSTTNQLNPEIGSERDHRAMIAAAQAARARAPGRLRPQPHGDRCRQPVVERRAHARPALGLRALLRHRLAGAHVGARQGRAAGPRRSLRRGRRARRAHRDVRRRRRNVYAALLRARVSAGAAHLRTACLPFAAARGVPDARGRPARSRPTPSPRCAAARATRRAGTRGAIAPRRSQRDVAEPLRRDAGARARARRSGRAGDRDPDRLDALLAAQHYRLVFWRVAADEINYRRFFDINDFAGLRVEDAEVLARTHELLFAMIGDGRIQGVRIDHIDGLANPGGYVNLLVDSRDRARPPALPRGREDPGSTTSACVRPGRSPGRPATIS